MIKAKRTMLEIMAERMEQRAKDLEEAKIAQQLTLEGLVKKLETSGSVNIKHFGTFKILPRKKGRSFCGFSNKEGVAKYRNRLRFIISKELRDLLCK